MTNQKPIHQIRLGRVKVAVWANETKNGTLYSVTIGRLYKDEEGWKTTASLSAKDLLIAGKVLNEAHSFIFAQAPKAGRSA